MLKKISLALLATAALMANLTAQNGCPGCVITLPALPADTIYLDPVPDGIKGVPYDEDMSFRLPKTTNAIPGAPAGLTIDQIEILNVAGLSPLGLDWTVSQAIFVPANQTDGCVKICGTPTVDGTYPVSIEVRATVIGIQQNTSFSLDFTIIDTSSIISTPFGCEPLTVNFNARPQPTVERPVSYLWDFGNGQTSTLQNPPAQVYAAGTYPVTLQSTIQKYVITSICANSLNNAWCGDVEEATCNACGPPLNLCPELYFTVANANASELFNSSGNVIAATSGCVNGISVELNAAPYTISLWDDDLVTGDDNLGNFPFNVTGVGTFNFSGNGTSGNYTVALITDTVMLYSDTLVVYPNPTPTVTVSGSPCLGAGGSVTLTSSFPTGNTWLQDGVEVLFGFGQSTTVFAPAFGNYQVRHVTDDGCESISAPVSITDCTAIEQLDGNNNRLTVQPNPTTDLLSWTLYLDGPSDYTLSLTETTGRVLMQQTGSAAPGNTTNILDLQSLPQGIYFLGVQTKQGHSSVKVVKF